MPITSCAASSVRPRVLLAGLALCAGLLGPLAPATAQTPALAALPASVMDTVPAPAEPPHIQQVTEDEQVRIEEVRVRGETRRLRVQSKWIKGLPAYEMTTPEGGSASGRPSQRVWLSLNF